MRQVFFNLLVLPAPLVMLALWQGHKKLNVAALAAFGLHYVMSATFTISMTADVLRNTGRFATSMGNHPQYFEPVYVVTKLKPGSVLYRDKI